MKDRFFCVLLFFSFILLSCSNDNDDESLNNYFVVEGEKCSIHSATCSFHGTIEDILDEFEIPPHGAFTIQFIYNESLHIFSFSIDGLSSYDAINIGKNFVPDGIVDINEFRRLTSIELSTRYREEKGKLSIIEKGTNYVVVNFEDFSFVKNAGNSENEFTINGKVKFVD